MLSLRARFENTFLEDELSCEGDKHRIFSSHSGETCVDSRINYLNDKTRRFPKRTCSAGFYCLGAGYQ